MASRTSRRTYSMAPASANMSHRHYIYTSWYINLYSILFHYITCTFTLHYIIFCSILYSSVLFRSILFNFFVLCSILFRYMTLYFRKRHSGSVGRQVESLNECIRRSLGNELECFPSAQVKTTKT